MSPLPQELETQNYLFSTFLKKRTIKTNYSVHDNTCIIETAEGHKAEDNTQFP